jgi:hypothetical protein
VNPYGRFDLDMNHAIGVAVIEMAPGDTTVGSTPKYDHMAPPADLEN